MLRASPAVVALAVLAFYALYLGVLLVDHGGPLWFVNQGTYFMRRDPNGTIGYDGQFYYALAVDPLGAAPALDSPSYRYSRIVYPLIAHIVALGRPTLVPYALLAVNVVAVALAAWALGSALRRDGVPPLFAAGYGLFLGQAVAVGQDLAEPLAYAFVVGAMLARRAPAWSCTRRDGAERSPSHATRAGPVATRWLAIGLLVLAGLTKETALLFAVAEGVVAVRRRDWSDAATVVGIPFAVLLAWQVFLWRWLGRWPVDEAGLSLVPLGGLLGGGAFDGPRWLNLGCIVLPAALWVAWLAWRRRGRLLDDPLAIALLLNFALVLMLPAKSFVEPKAAGRLATGTVVAAVAESRFGPPWLRMLTLFLWTFVTPIALPFVLSPP